MVISAVGGYSRYITQLSLPYGADMYLVLEAPNELDALLNPLRDAGGSS